MADDMRNMPELTDENRNEFERHTALAIWMNRLANTPGVMSLAEWMAFCASLNSALNAARTEGPRAPDQGWRPIETAPKNKPVDLWVKFATGSRRVPDAHWNAAFGEWQLGQYHTGQYADRPEPTHWRPLPEPPGAEPDQGEEVERLREAP